MKPHLMKRCSKFQLQLICFVLFFSANIAFAGLAEDLHSVQQQWAIANYETQGDAQEKAFADLTDKVNQLTSTYPTAAEMWIWSGIVKSSYAGARGGLGALSLAKQSRNELEKALTLDDDALEGSAYTSLGALYSQVPGFPIGFGSDKKAKAMFAKAMAINPTGIDSNYFYAQFLLDQGDLEQAQQHYLLAQQAPARPDRPLADAGRQKEIIAGLHQVQAKLHK